MPFREAHPQVASRVPAGERFSEPTAEQAAGARQSPEALPISWTGWPRPWVVEAFATAMHAKRE